MNVNVFTHENIVQFYLQGLFANVSTPKIQFSCYTAAFFILMSVGCMEYIIERYSFRG